VLACMWLTAALGSVHSVIHLFILDQTRIWSQLFPCTSAI